MIPAPRLRGVDRRSDDLDADADRASSHPTSSTRVRSRRRRSVECRRLLRGRDRCVPRRAGDGTSPRSIQRDTLADEPDLPSCLVTELPATAARPGNACGTSAPCSDSTGSRRRRRRPAVAGPRRRPRAAQPVGHHRRWVKAVGPVPDALGHPVLLRHRIPGPARPRLLLELQMGALVDQPDRLVVRQAAPDAGRLRLDDVGRHRRLEHEVAADRQESRGESSPDELAHEVWRQITTELGPPLGEDVNDLQFPQPCWYWIDRFIEYRGGVGRSATPRRTSSRS